MKIIVQFSGGKDSQACLIKAVNDSGKDKVTAVFCVRAGNMQTPTSISTALWSNSA